MQSKLQAIAKTFVREVGDDLPRYTFVFPNHRAGLFFRKYLSQYVSKPMFAPRVMSINECFAELSDLHVADPLTLLLRLYSEYKRYDTESLEHFIYWGKMMLADFSEIDNHLVPHVEGLFASIRDLHAIEERFSYLSPEQRRALSQFWKEFQESDKRHPNNELHHQFLHTWDLLYPLYQNLRENLLKDGLAYEGMLHRHVIDHWDDIPQERFSYQYVFLGFNALTTSERELMLRLQKMDRADFYFDYDSPYLYDKQNRASLFMRQNLEDFSSRYAIPAIQYSTPELTLVSVPSTIGEVHEVHRILSEIIPSAEQDLTRTAIVLPDEQLLVPLLNAFPESVEKINVTMGYPLRATSLYMKIAYPEQFITATHAADFLQQMRTLLLAQYNTHTSEAIYQLVKVLDRLESAIMAYPQIAFSVADMQQLLKMLTLESTIPYVGEPLDGLQVMGVLETRALDFDNIIITDFNDDLYPGRSRNNSFIPYVLRVGFNMPTPDRQNAIFAYNFYRMLSYAKHVWFIANSTADDQHSGEVSRYYYQLLWQYNLSIQHTIVGYSLDSKLVASAAGCESIKKDERVQQLCKFSASALTTYLRCPKQFYYKYVEGLKEPEKDETVSVSEATLGNVLHEIMHVLYSPLVGKNITQSTIQSIISQVNDDAYWTTLEPLKDLQGDQLAAMVVRTYVNNVLNYDYAHAPFQLLLAEKPVEVRLSNGLKIVGKIDRADQKGGVVRVIDYKTGSADLEYKSMEDVFGVVSPAENGEYAIRKGGKSYILQTLLYCWILSKDHAKLSPYLYPVRRISDVDAITGIHQVGSEEAMLFDDEIKQEFVRELECLVDEIRNPELSYCPATNDHVCGTCAFLQLCGRQSRQR